MERNKVKIICNPYEKTIAYKRWEWDDVNGFQWKDLGSNSNLIKNKEFINATIQHNAYEIVGELSNEYNRGDIGLDIIFEGTEEDYHDLKEVVKRFYSEKNIEYKWGDRRIESAETVMPKIQNIFSDMAKLFYEYKSEAVINIISQFLNATKTTIPICVVGLYSTGKSAFINALVGEEILPSATDPTTARIFEVIESEEADKGEIRFSVSGEKISMLFEGDKYKISGNIEEDLRSKLNDCLENTKLKSLTRNIYHSLKVINDYANDDGKKDIISQLITVDVPFSNGIIKKAKYKFAIYDTPGSDSKSHEEHFRVLEKALGEQTNGLPILLFGPQDKDREGADKLLEALNGIDGKLDLTNAMVVINKVEDEDEESLKVTKGKANTILMRWKSNRLYFLSAILGLGSKKIDCGDVNGWIDGKYRKIFATQKDTFVDSESEFYMQLYIYNQMAEDRKEKYLKSVSGKTQERELLYINSGLHCIEQEIVEFAEKYALYNKCSQAQDYLEQAMDCTTGQIEKLKQEQERIQKKAIVEMKGNKEKLLENLKKNISKEKEEFYKGYPKHMDSHVEMVKQESIREMQSYIDAMWKAVKENVKWGERVENFLPKCKRKSKEIKEGCRVQLRRYSGEYCGIEKKKLQEKCCEIVKGDESLKDEERDFLQQFIMNLKMPEDEIRPDEISADDISWKFWIFNLKFLDDIDPKITKEKFEGNLKKYIVRNNAQITEQHRQMFDEWAEQLQSGLKTKIIEMNPRLRGEAKMIKELQEKIKEKGRDRKYILSKLNEVKEMFEFKMIDKEKEA